ncbi:hypothetical protein EGW08_011365 [Elysia chlorotica]|uniref:Major facilitator superfamily (MFS) profile domain-containing protein n=1 Tax=Elysia chlorotica TaxID=188477 RepID=A0A433TH64_ELYCH|nr:hypothetical protein EGW08_011365 [Elysia chlorotica]
MAFSSQNAENLILSLGGKGRFQLTILFLAAFTYVPLVLNHVIMAFHGSPIPHKCMVGSGSVIDTNLTSLAGPRYLTSGTEAYVTNLTHSECSTTVGYSDGQQKIIKCKSDQWKYTPKHVHRNIVSQFDLVCSKKYLVSLATTIYFTGVMLGGLVFGDLADRFGRLPVMLFTLYASIVVGLATAFSVSYAMFVCLRFVHGVLIQGLQTSAYTLLMELFGPKDRPFAGIVAELFFGVAFMVLGGLAYLLRDWQHLQIAASLVAVVTVFYPWVVPESLRWLIMKGKTEEAEKQIQRICKTNKIPFPAECWGLLKDSMAGQAKTVRQHNLTHLFRSRPMTKISLICFYLWFTMSVSYYGLTFKMTSFKGNPYLNFFISGLVESFTYLACIPLMNKFGRRKPLMYSFACGGVMCLSSGLINSFTSGLDHLVTGFALTGKCSMACCFATFFVYASELYPTAVRNIGLGAGMFFARFGSVMAPQINQWADLLLGIDGILIFGVLAVAASVLVYPLPETHQKHLADSLGEAGEPAGGAEVARLNTEEEHEMENRAVEA